MLMLMLILLMLLVLMKVFLGELRSEVLLAMLVMKVTKKESL